MWQTKSRPNATAKIPYAYKADENDPLVLHPDQDVVVLVEEAMDYLDQGHSSRRTASWLSEKTGRYNLSPRSFKYLEGSSGKALQSFSKAVKSSVEKMLQKLRLKKT